MCLERHKTPPKGSLPSRTQLSRKGGLLKPFCLGGTHLPTMTCDVVTKSRVGFSRKESELPLRHEIPCVSVDKTLPSFLFHLSLILALLDVGLFRHILPFHHLSEPH
jgi:hypothetical protein